MRRIISILTVALIMAAMIVVMAAPAFAQGPFAGNWYLERPRQEKYTPANKLARNLGRTFLGCVVLFNSTGTARA